MLTRILALLSGTHCHHTLQMLQQSVLSSLLRKHLFNLYWSNSTVWFNISKEEGVIWCIYVWLVVCFYLLCLTFVQCSPPPVMFLVKNTWVFLGISTLGVLLLLNCVDPHWTWQLTQRVFLSNQNVNWGSPSCAQRNCTDTDLSWWEWLVRVLACSLGFTNFHSCRPLSGVNLSTEFVNLYFSYTGQGLCCCWWQRHFEFQQAHVVVEGRSSIAWNTHAQLQNLTSDELS